MKKNYLLNFVLLISLSLFISCKGLNDNPSKRINKLSVDITEAKKKVGYSTNIIKKQSKELTTPQSSTSTNEVKSLIVGAMVVASSSEAYTENSVITAEVENAIRTDLINSSNYFKIVSLPVEADQIEFDVPLPSAGDWQVVVAGLKTSPNAISDLIDNPANDKSIAYIGFNDRLLNSDGFTDQVINVNLKRLCLLKSRPKGCAVFNDIDNEFVAFVTPAVEIIEIKYNGVSYSNSEITFPIIVRDPVDEGRDLLSFETTSEDAISNLVYIKEGIINLLAGQGESLSSLEVVTTHMTNNSESLSCKNLSGAQVTVENITSAGCETAIYRTNF